MMNRKRIIVLAMVIALVVSSAFASVIQLGAYGELKGWKFRDAETFAYTDLDSYSFGPEVRINLAFLQAGATANLLDVTKGMDGTAQISLLSGTKHFSLALGAAVPYRLDYSEGFNADNILEAPLSLRLGVNANMGPIGIGLAYYLPTSLELGTAHRNLRNISLDPDSGRMQVSAFLNLL